LNLNSKQKSSKCRTINSILCQTVFRRRCK